MSPKKIHFFQVAAGTMEICLPIFRFFPSCDCRKPLNFSLFSFRVVAADYEEETRMAVQGIEKTKVLADLRAADRLKPLHRCVPSHYTMHESYLMYE